MQGKSIRGPNRSRSFYCAHCKSESICHVSPLHFIAFALLSHPILKIPTFEYEAGGGRRGRAMSTCTVFNVYISSEMVILVSHVIVFQFEFRNERMSVFQSAVLCCTIASKAWHPNEVGATDNRCAHVSVKTNSPSPPRLALSQLRLAGSASWELKLFSCFSFSMRVASAYAAS